MAAHVELVRVGNREVPITRPEKVLFPADGITKGELIKYYHDIAPRMLPHLEDRPLSLQRYPDGIDKFSFFQKSTEKYFPEWIRTVTVKKAGGTVRHVVCNDVATLVYLANLAAITQHIWLSRADKLLYPDQMVFDLDPSGDTFPWVKAAARSLKTLLDRLDLPAFLKTSGSRGLHVVVPLQRRHTFSDVHGFAHHLAAVIVREQPDQRTLEFTKKQRGGRVFIDIHRNAYAQTVAPAFTVRARPGAPVSVPIAWDELESRGLRSDGWTIRNVFGRLRKQPDPWKDFWKRRVSLGAVMQKIERA
jgi:bifunctional non-homologous end joining protein LigD